MNSKIKSLVETSSEVRDFELRDVDELGIWLPALRVEGLLTGYFANYVGDSDGLFIVLDSEPGKIYRIDDLEAFKACLGDVEVWVDVDWLVYGVKSDAEWRPVEGTEEWVIVDEPWKLVDDYAEKMTALEYTRTQNWAAQRDYDNWKADVEHDFCPDDLFYWDGYRNEVFKVNEPVTIVALDEGLGKYRADEYLVLKGDHTERIAAEEEKYGTASGKKSVMKFIDKPGYVWFEPEFERIEFIGSDTFEAVHSIIEYGIGLRDDMDIENHELLYDPAPIGTSTLPLVALAVIYYFATRANYCEGEERRYKPDFLGVELNKGVLDEMNRVLDIWVESQLTEEELGCREWKGWGIFAKAEIDNGELVLEAWENV